MNNKDVFAEYHPVVNFIFFLGMLVSTMTIFDGILIVISFVGSFSYGLYLGGKKFVKTVGMFVLPVMILSIVVNLYINQRGSTVLLYFLKRPISLEALVYGGVTAMAFASVLMWFYAYNYVMTSDKFLYIFGKLAPTLSLVFSMVLRFIPLFQKRASLISFGQKCIGHDMSSGNRKERMRHGTRVLSIMTTWSLENAIDTSDSMKARGYGLEGRTFYHQYHWARRDIGMISVLLGLLLVIFIGIPMLGMSVYYYPVIEWKVESRLWAVVYVGGFVWAFLPILMNVFEIIKWKYLESKIENK